MLLVQTMKNEGKLIDVKSELAEEVEECEKELLNFGYEYNQIKSHIEEEVISLLRKFSKEKVEKDEAKVYSGDSSGVRYLKVLCERILIKEQVKKLKSRLDKKPGLGICLDGDEDGDYNGIYIHESDLDDIDINEFLDALHERAVNLMGADKILKKREKLLKRTEILIEKLKKRTRDPHTFWETLGKALMDLFK